jgi:hypothetical protein
MFLLVPKMDEKRSGPYWTGPADDLPFSEDRIARCDTLTAVQYNMNEHST